MARDRSDTLVIAPRTNLPSVDREVTAVVRHLRAEILQGDVNLDMILSALETQRKIIWFMTHGSTEGILISTGFVKPSSLIQTIRNAHAELVVLNTCNSIRTASALHNELRLYLVCTLRDVPDETAYVTGRLFAQGLAQGMSYGNAYNSAIPGGNEDWVFFPGKEEQVNTPPHRRDSRDPSDKDALAHMQEMINQLDAVINGNPRFRIQGIAATLDNLSQAVAKLQDHVDETDRSLKAVGTVQRAMRGVQWGILATLIVLVLIVLWFILGPLQAGT